MQIFKKALSLILALALVLSCIPALSGSVSAIADSKTALAQQQAISGITTKNLQTLLADEVGNVTLHGVSYMEYTDVDNGSNGTVWMYGRVDNNNAKLFGYKEDFYATSSPAYGGNAYWHLRESAGGRIRFATNSNYIAIEATLFHRNANYASNMEAAKYGFDVYADTVDGSVYVGTIRDNNPTSAPTTVTVSGALDLTSAPTDANGNYSLTIYFPITIETREVSLGIAQDAEYLTHSVAYSSTAPIVYYGSSITQGGIVKYPGDAYTAIAGRMLNADYINLGTWGSCYGYEASAPYVAGLNMSVFVMDYDHNESVATNSDKEDNNSLAEKHYDFYKIIRTANPNIPIIMITRPNNSPVSTKDGVVTVTSADMKAVILESYNRAITENKDQNVHFIDGEAFFNYDGGVISANGTYTKDGVYLSDKVHPNAKGQAAMADVVASVIRLANAGYKNIYVDKDEISFGGNKEDILFDSTDAIDAMDKNDWTNGTVVGKTLVLNGETATLTADQYNKWSGYTAVAALNIASGATASMYIGECEITVASDGTVTAGGDTYVFTSTPNANGSVDVVLQATLIDDNIEIYVNSVKAITYNAGVMGGTIGFDAVDGQVTVNSLQVTTPTQRKGYTAELGDKIALNLHMYLTDAVAADTGAYMKFTCNDVETEVAMPEPVDGVYTFTCEVAAKEMTDDVIAELYNANNQMIARHVTTVKDYANKVIGNNSNSRKDRDIAAALLNYGAAAQLYFKSPDIDLTDTDLANNGFAADWGANINLSALSSYAPTSPNGTISGVDFFGSSLVTEGYTIIRHYFKTDNISGLTATYSFGNETFSPEFKKSDTDGFYYIDITDIDAASLDYTFVLTVSSGQNTMAIRYSALSYVYQILTPSPDYTPTEDLQRLAKALYLYSLAADQPNDPTDNEFDILPF